MSSCRQKCMRPGRITNNGYLNFLREFRKTHCGKTAVETVIAGAKAWNKLSEAEKAKYKLMGCKPMRQKRRRQRTRSRSRRRGRKTC